MTLQKKIPPVIKWSGSKRNVASKIGQLIPSAERYFEPFLGGGAVIPFRKTAKGLAGDIIPELIALWNAIKTNPHNTANEYRKRWEKLQKEGHHVYYEVRDRFNTTRNEHDFLFLTRTCVNGLIRYNAKGEFNNSFHLTRPGINPDTLASVIFQWHTVVKDVAFYHCDYRTLLKEVKKDDFVFLDPPYGGTKGRYTNNAFDIQELFNHLDALNYIGAKWILTFDGVAGNREYSYAVPRELYKSKLNMATGLSPFTRMMKTSVDVVNESVYLNFEAASKFFTQTGKHIGQESGRFSAVNM
jgi:DNA adenine methylase